MTATTPATFKYKFNFKAISLAVYASLFDDYAAAGESKEAFYARINGEFEFKGLSVDPVTGEQKVIDEKSYAKRKSIELDLIEPAECAVARANLGEQEAGFIVDLVQRAVTDYVKLQYVDAFAPVGEHALSDIIAYRATMGGRGGSVAIDAAVIEAAIKSFKDVMVKALDNAQAAELLAKIAQGRFTQSAVSRGSLTPSEETAKKLQARVDQWAQWLNDNNAELADELAPVYALWSNNLAKLSKAPVIDLESFI